MWIQNTCCTLFYFFYRQTRSRANLTHVQYSLHYISTLYLGDLDTWSNNIVLLFQILQYIVSPSLVSVINLFSCLLYDLLQHGLLGLGGLHHHNSPLYSLFPLPLLAFTLPLSESHFSTSDTLPLHLCPLFRSYL